MAHVVAAFAHDTTVTADFSQLSTLRHLAGGFVEGCVVSLLFLFCFRVVPVVLGGLFRVGRLTGSHYFFLFLAEMALALALASAFEDAPHARNESKRRVGSPFGLRSGPGMLPMRARNDARRGLSPDLTGAFKFIPCALADARPLAFKPPLGFLPSLRCHAGVLIGLPPTHYRQGSDTCDQPSLPVPSQPSSGCRSTWLISCSGSSYPKTAFSRWLHFNSTRIR